MKKILILGLVLLSWHINNYAQMPTNGNYSNWDWENNNQDNWKRKDGNTWKEIRPAFAPSTEKVGLMVPIYATSDYTKAKGWKLIYADFEGEYPYFVLYNTHKSIIRTYTYTEGGQVSYSYILAMLQLQCNNNPFRVLSLSDAGVNAIDSEKPNSSNFVSCIIPGVGLNSWAVAEFPILFDDKNIGLTGYNWVISFYACDYFDIKLTLNGQATPLSTNAQGPYTLTSATNPISGTTFNAGVTKFTGNVQSVEKLIDSMNKSADDILKNTNNETILKDYANLVKSVQNYTDVVHAVSSGASALGAIVGFVRMIFGISDPAKSTPPVAYTLQAELSGTMNIQRPLRSATLSIPGAYSYFPGNLPWQPYNCPIGIINLKKEPVIKCTTPFDRYAHADPNTTSGSDKNGNLSIIYNLDGYPYLEIPSNIAPCTTYPEKYSGKYVQYKFDEDIVLAKQNIDGLTLKDVKFALVCKPNGTGDKKYKINTKYLAYHYFTYGQINVPIGATNTVYKAIQEGKLIIHKYDEANDEVYFGTPYIPMNQFKGVTIEVPEYTDIKLGVLATFQSNIYNDLILFKTEYIIKKDTPIPANKTKIFLGWEQTNFPYSDYYETNQYEFNNSPNSGNYTGKQIILKPGFKSGNGFRATARDYKGNGNTVINQYSYNCSSSLRSAKTTEDALDMGTIDVTRTPVNIYPNPCYGVLYVRLPDDSPSVKIEVHNLWGHLIKTYTGITNESVLDVSSLSKGIYIFKIRTTKGNHSQKIHIN